MHPKHDPKHEASETHRRPAGNRRRGTRGCEIANSSIHLIRYRDSRPRPKYNDHVILQLHARRDARTECESERSRGPPDPPTAKAAVRRSLDFCHTPHRPVWRVRLQIEDAHDCWWQGGAHRHNYSVAVAVTAASPAAILAPAARSAASLAASARSDSKAVSNSSRVMCELTS